MWDFPASRSGYKRVADDLFVPFLAGTLRDFLTGENSRLASLRSGRPVTAGGTGIPASGGPALALSGIRMRIPCFTRIPLWKGFWNRQNDSGAHNPDGMKVILGKPGLWTRIFHHCRFFSLELEIKMPSGAPRIEIRLTPLAGNAGGTAANASHEP